MRILAALLLLVLLPPLAAQDKQPKPFAQRVNAAIDSGVAWLKQRQGADGSWNDREQFDGGGTALCLLALSRAGVQTDDPVLKKGFARLKQYPFRKTYVVAVTVLALEAAFCHRREEKFYTRSMLSANPQAPWMIDAVKWLVARYRKDLRGWRYPRDGVDNSHIQYVLLALKAACRCGLGHLIPNDIWREVLVGLIERQEKTGPLVRLLGHREKKKKQRSGSTELQPLYPTRGQTPARGWSYDPRVPNDAVTGSMTTAGIASVLLCQSELIRRRDRGYTKRLHYEGNTAIEGGLAWLAHNWDVKRNPRHPRGEWHYYYLFGLERVGVFCRLEKIGSHDWYREGAEVLLKDLQEGEAWPDEEKTCYALLFLKRASVPPISGR